MQKAWMEEKAARLQNPASNDQPWKIPLGKKLLRVLLVGGGGCGKTRIETLVLVPLFKAFFGPQSCLCTAPSNKAARLVNGKTTHSACKLGAGKMDVASLKTKADQKQALARQFVRLGALINDEFSQCSAKLYHAFSYRFVDSRASSYFLNPGDYLQSSDFWSHAHRGYCRGRAPASVCP